MVQDSGYRVPVRGAAGGVCKPRIFTCKGYRTRERGIGLRPDDLLYADLLLRKLRNYYPYFG